MGEGELKHLERRGVASEGKTNLVQRRAIAITYERRQQPGRRYGALRKRSGLSDKIYGYHRERGWLCTFCGIRDDITVGASLVEDGIVGAYGSYGCFAERISPPKKCCIEINCKQNS